MAGTGISFHRQTVQILTPTATTDRYGNQTSGWNNATVTSVDGCRVLPRLSDEVLDRRTDRWVLYAPPDTALTSADRVRIDGITYDVDGEVRRWLSPSGALAHLEADLERVKG